jgi:hypothetical protein
MDFLREKLARRKQKKHAKTGGEIPQSGEVGQPGGSIIPIANTSPAPPRPLAAASSERSYILVERRHIPVVSDFRASPAQSSTAAVSGSSQVPAGSRSKSTVSDQRVFSEEQSTSAVSSGSSHAPARNLNVSIASDLWGFSQGQSSAAVSSGSSQVPAETFSVLDTSDPWNSWGQSRALVSSRSSQAPAERRSVSAASDLWAPLRPTVAASSGSKRVSVQTYNVPATSNPRAQPAPWDSWAQPAAAALSTRGLVTAGSQSSQAPVQSRTSATLGTSGRTWGPVLNPDPNGPRYIMAEIDQSDAPTLDPLSLFGSGMHREFRIIRDQVLREIAKPFQYPPVDNNKNEIRLLDLGPGKSVDVFQCTLYTVSLDNPPPYEALSYTWGPREQSSTIILNENGHLDITRNLDEALVYLRSETQKRTLWIDALCIDQENGIEKADQVKKMLQIYRRAESVLIWLGPERDSSNDGLDLLEKMGASGFDQRFDEVDTDNEHPWGALQRLFNRPWWKRVWVSIIYAPKCRGKG